MKRLFYFVVTTTFLLACNNTPKDFLTLSGQITNKNSDSLVIGGMQTKNGEPYRFKKTIKVNEDGSFSDTLKIQAGHFNLFDGKEYAFLYLKNGADVHITLDTKEFDETIAFKGDGALENSFLAISGLKQEQFYSSLDSFLAAPQESFDAKINDYINDFDKRISNTALDTAFVSSQKKGIEQFQKRMNKMREQKMYVTTKLAKGTISPTFENYENFNGGTTSLQDLKDKYVYIDLWATWCQPCKAEIPHLQKIEKQFHDKNISFVSISIDDKKDYQTWKKMVTDKELTGIQLFADNAWKSKFAEEYMVKSIPRFLLIDKEGKIVNADAPRPSEPKLVELLNTLDI